ncbi:hypothetical protein LTR37_001489 [Vermiconidia calcicola]|uniref:Uncharacterized protein n=1 Tax=Vermiconidia calcicola TaxID=1690605 RepID=A0ACC3NWA1_9PEZI|nr:hypothetical protein LTR37_001489 [Vermiconidia calcicola]
MHRGSSPSSDHGSHSRHATFKRTLTAAVDRLSPLPAEVRNRIYAFAIPHNSQYFHESLSPGICRTSSGLRKETLPIWRGNNTFLYYCTKPITPQSGLPSFDPGFDIGIKHMQRLQLVMEVQGCYYPLEKCCCPSTHSKNCGWGFQIRIDKGFSELAMCFIWLGDSSVRIQVNSMPNEEWKEHCLPYAEKARAELDVHLDGLQTSRTIRIEVLQTWLRNVCFIFAFTTAQFNKLQSGQASFMNRPLEDGFQLLHHIKLTYLCVPNASKWTRLLMPTANGVFLEVKGRQYRCQPIRIVTTDTSTRHYSSGMANPPANSFIFVVQMSHDEREEINQKVDALVDEVEKLLGRTLTMKATGAEWKCGL